MLSNIYDEDFGAKSSIVDIRLGSKYASEKIAGATETVPLTNIFYDLDKFYFAFQLIYFLNSFMTNLPVPI